MNPTVQPFAASSFDSSGSPDSLLPDDLLRDCIVEYPTKYPGLAELKWCPKWFRLEDVLAIPGVFQTRPDPKTGRAQLYLPWNLWTMGQGAARLEHLEEDPAATTPSGLELKWYQRKGVSFIRSMNQMSCGCVLSYDPGLGKTLVILQAMQVENLLGERILVIGPLGAYDTWCSEGGDPFRHYGLRVNHLSGTQAHPGALTASNCHFIHFDVIKSWTSLLFNWRPRIIIIDESHLLMSSESARTRDVAGLTAASYVQWRVALTGTPIPKTRMDLYSQLNIIQPNQWGRSKIPYGTRYCLAAGTKIATSSLRETSIEELRVGDSVLGFTIPEPNSCERTTVVRTVIKNIFRYWAQLWKLTLANGQIIYTTEEHQWFTGLKPRLENPYQPAKGIRGITKRRIRWYGRLPSTTDMFSEQYMRGWLRGVMDGDGHCKRCPATSKFLKKLRTGHFYTSVLVQAGKNSAVIHRAAVFANEIGWYAVPHEQADGRWVVRFTVQRKSGRGRTGKPCYQFFKEDLPDVTDNDFWRGWLSGIYDAEGWSCIISQCASLHPHVHKRIGECLKLFGFDCIQQLDLKKDPISVGWIWRGGDRAARRFLEICTPCLYGKLDGLLLHSLRKGGVSIAAFEPSGIWGYVYNIETATGNYIAEGLSSKNSGGHQVLHSEDAAHWVFDGQTHTEELRARLAGVYLRVTKAQVPGMLPRLRREAIEVKLSDESRLAYGQAQKDIKGYKEKTESDGQLPSEVIIGGEQVEVPESQRGKKALALVVTGALKTLLDKGKLPIALEKATELCGKHARLLVFTWKRDSADWLYNELSRRALASQQKGNPAPAVFGPIDGNVEHTIRASVARAFASSPWSILIATQGSLGVSINALSAADACLQTMPDWNPDSNLQLESRLHRMGATAAEITSYYLIARGTLDDRILVLMDEKAREAAELSDVDTAGMHLVSDLEGGSLKDGSLDLDAICRAADEIEALLNSNLEG